MIFRQLKIVPVFLLTLFFCAGCSRETSINKTDNVLTVYTSFYAMYDFAKDVAKDVPAEIVNLVPAGAEPHEWEPTPKDLEKMSGADLFIYNGNHMEHWADKVIQTLPDTLTVVEAAAGLHPEALEQKQEGDPHIWLNPVFAIQEIEAIRDGFQKADPAHTKAYAENAARLIGEVQELDRRFREAVSQFSGTDIVTAHGAYAYLCEAYGLHQTAIEGILGDSDPTPAQMEKIMAILKEKNIRYIFFDPNEGGRAAKIIAQEAGVQTLTLNAFESDSENRGYVEVMTENLENLKKALA